MVVDDVFVPDYRAASSTDPPVLAGSRYRFPPWTREIPGCAAMALDIARSAVDALIELARVKQPERSSQMLSEEPVTSKDVPLLDRMPCWQPRCSKAHPWNHATWKRLIKSTRSMARVAQAQPCAPLEGEQIT